MKKSVPSWFKLGNPTVDSMSLDDARAWCDDHGYNYPDWLI
jgi:hypothetical protein